MNIPYKRIKKEVDAYEAETNYYLLFQIESALISLDYIVNYRYSKNCLFKSKAQYYHYYVDHLLFSMGQIAERFRINDNPPKKERKYYERRKATRHNYGFNESIFPILSNKHYRNTIEHIDEHNINIINSYNTVGGFNYIDKYSLQELIDALLNDSKRHTYTLNLLTKEIFIIRNNIQYIFSLVELKQELIKLRKQVNDFWEGY